MQINLVLRKGVTESGEFQILENGSAMDLTGCTWRGHARREELADSPIEFEFTFSYNAETRFVKWTVLGTETADVAIGQKPDDRASQFFYDFELTWPGGDIDFPQEGKITLKRVITRT